MKTLPAGELPAGNYRANATAFSIRGCPAHPSARRSDFGASGPIPGAAACVWAGDAWSLAAGAESASMYGATGNGEGAQPGGAARGNLADMTATLNAANRESSQNDPVWDIEPRSVLSSTAGRPAGPISWRGHLARYLLLADASVVARPAVDRPRTARFDDLEIASHEPSTLQATGVLRREDRL